MQTIDNKRPSAVKKAAGVGVASGAALMLTGCFSVNMDFEIGNDTSDLVQTISFDAEELQNFGSELQQMDPNLDPEELEESPEDLIQDIFPEEECTQDAVGAEELVSGVSDFDGEIEVDYEIDGTVATCTISVRDIPTDQMMSAMSDDDDADFIFEHREDDGVYYLAMEGEDVDNTELQQMQMMMGGEAPDVSMSFSFPGDIIESTGGEADGNTFTVSGIEDIMSGFEVEASDGTNDSDVLMWVLIGAGVVLIPVIVLVSVIAVRSSRSNAVDNNAYNAPGGGQNYAPQSNGNVTPPQQQNWGQGQQPPQ